MCYIFIFFFFIYVYSSLKKIPHRVAYFVERRLESKATIDSLLAKKKLNHEQYEELYSILYERDSLSWWRFFFGFGDMLSKKRKYWDFLKRMKEFGFDNIYETEAFRLGYSAFSNHRNHVTKKSPPEISI